MFAPLGGGVADFFDGAGAVFGRVGPQRIWTSASRLFESEGMTRKPDAGKRKMKAKVRRDGEIFVVRKFPAAVAVGARSFIEWHPAPL